MQETGIIIIITLAVIYLVYAAVKRYRAKKACDKCPLSTRLNNN